MIGLIHVRLFFYGLIAFVGQNDGTSVLLPRMAGHTPFLAYSGRSGEPIEFKKFRASGDGEEVRITGSVTKILSGDLHPQDVASSGPIKLPRTSGEGASLEWVAAMSSILQVKPFVKKEYIGEKPNSLPGLVTRLAGRLQLGNAAGMETCRLVEVTARCGGTKNDMIFAYDLGHIHQALAEVVVASVTVPEKVLELQLWNLKTGGKTDAIALSPFDCNGHKCINIFLANLPPLAPGLCPERKISKDFNNFLSLLQNPLAIPRRLRSVEANITPTSSPHVPLSCAKVGLPEPPLIMLFSPNSRPICPMVLF